MLVLCLLLLLLMTPVMASTGPGTPRADAPRPPGLVMEPFALDAGEGRKVGAERGRLRVPENRRRPGSRQIELAFVRIKSTAREPGPPIVYLAGGPGESGIDTARGPGAATFMALRQVADVIALDQRGVGHSEPNLDCSGTWDFPLDRPGDPAEMLRLASERVRACAREMERRGIDLMGYHTEESAEDVEALRRALGVPKISLWGVSYGTHLALAVLRRHERRIHRVVLTGVDGPDHALLKLPSTIQAQLLKVDRLCKADPRVRRLVPDLLGLVTGTLKRLEREPVRVDLPDPASGGTTQVTIGAWDFRYYAAHAVMNTWRLMKLPAVFGPLAKGDFEPLGREVLQFRRSRIPPMMGLMVVSASGASPERRARIKREAGQTLLGDAFNFPFPELCEAVRHPDLGPSFRRPVRSSVPTLFISGSLDGNTPVANAEEVRRGFSNSQHLIVEGASHGFDLFYFAPGLNEAMVRFLGGRPLLTHRIKLSSFPFVLDQPEGKR